MGTQRIPTRAAGPLPRLTICFFVAERREENLGVVMVAAHLDACQRDHADARILEFRADQFREVRLDLVGDPAEAGGFFAMLYGPMKMTGSAADSLLGRPPIP